MWAFLWGVDSLQRPPTLCCYHQEMDSRGAHEGRGGGGGGVKGEPDQGRDQALGDVVSVAQRRWLITQSGRWVASGIITAQQAERIAAHYPEQASAAVLERHGGAAEPAEKAGQEASDEGQNVALKRRTGVNALLHAVGTALVGVAIVWLVGANLDHFNDGGKTVLFTVLLGVFATGAAAARKYVRQAGAWVFMLQTLTVVALGATIFQTAMWRGVDEPQPWIVGLWAAGALGYTFLSGSVAAAVIGAILGTVFVPWQVVDWASPERGEGSASVLAVTATCVTAALSAAAAQWLSSAFGVLAMSWRVVGTMATVAGVLVFGMNTGLSGGSNRAVLDSLPLIGALSAVAIAAVAVTWWRNRRAGRDVLWGTAEAVSPVVAVWVFLALNAAAAAMEATAFDASTGDVQGSLAALALGVALLVLGIAVCLWYAVLGTVRDAPATVVTAVAALVLFVGAQTTTLFLPFLSGAWVALIVGVVLIALAWGLNEGRPVLRRLVVRHQRS